MSERFWPYTGVAGIVFVALFVLGLVITGDGPTYDEGGEAVAAWFADNGTRYLVGDFIIGLGFILFYFPFLLGLTLKLRRAEGDPPILSGIVFGGGLLFPAAGAAGGVPQAGLALLEGNVSPDVAALAAAGTLYGFGIAGAAGAILTGASAILILRTGAFWNWLAWLGVLVAALSIVGTASPIQNDPEGILAIIQLVGFIGFGVWIIAASVALLQARYSPTAVTAA
jgi:hypothetical protein